MADAQGRHLGNDVLLYVATSAPTTAADDTDAAYELVALLINNDLSSAVEAVSAADKAVSGFISRLPGTGEYEISVSASRKNIADTGHEIIRDAHFARTQTIYWLLTTGTTGDDCAHGTGMVSAYSEPNPVNEFVTFEATILSQGAPTYATVPA